jgi:hypothetical protein
VFTNGGMCLLADKAIAFQNIYDSLKRHGKFEGIISALKLIDLPAQYEWPYCIARFSPLKIIQLGFQRAGFRNIMVTNIGKEYDMKPGVMPMKNDKTGKTEMVDISEYVGF